VIPPEQPLLELRGVWKAFGSVQALQGVDFAIYPREIHALVGDNGAGKSTLVKLISGVHQPDRGVIEFQGRPIRIASPEDAFALGVSTVYQDLALIGTRDVANNLFVGREPTRGPFVDRRKMVAEARRFMGALNVRIPSVEVKVAHLSGGQRQGVAIACAVHKGSSILLMDEPTAALGVRESHQILNLIEELRAQGKAIVIVSHNLHHVFRVADRITVLRGGRLIASRRKSETSADEVVRMITGADLL